MKLAEALQQRADLARRIEQLRSRLHANATMQEDVPPAEDPQELLAELDRCLNEEEFLVTHINLTNAHAKVEGETLTALLARRDSLKKRIEIYQNLCSEGSSLGNRYSKSEIRILPAVNVRELRKQCDSCSEIFRKLDTAIQAANWRIELR